MFILDSLMISGLRWVLNTVATAADAEMNDDSVLREQLLEAEMRREGGEISDAEFAEIEQDLLARIREIRERREGGTAPLTMGGEAMGSAPDTRFHVEASVSGDFYDAAAAPHTTVIDAEPGHLEELSVLHMDEGAPSPDGSNRSRRPGRRGRSTGTAGTRASGTRRANRKIRS